MSKLGIALLAVFFLAAAAPTPHPSQSTFQSSTSASSSLIGDAEAAPSRNPWLDPIAIFTGLLVLVGAGQIYFLRNTDIATTKAANAAKASADAVTSQLRAYIQVNIAGRPHLEVGPLQIVLAIKNTGQTPAYDTIVCSNIGITLWPNPAQTFQDVVPTVRVPIVLSPGQEFNNIPVLDNITAHEIAGLKAKALRIVVWGRVDYVDTFKIARFSKFAFSLETDGTKFLPPFIEGSGTSAD